MRTKHEHETSESDEDDLRNSTNTYPQIQHNLPLVTKEYEEAFLREPIGMERACAAGNDCEGLVINSSPGFVLREFLLPHDHERFQRCGTLPRNPQLCLLCTRKDIQRNLLALKARPVTITGVLFSIQSYGNIIDQVGEYKHGICHPVQPEFGIVAPIVRHKRKLLRYMVDAQGVRWYKQIRVEYEDPRKKQQQQLLQQQQQQSADYVPAASQMAHRSQSQSSTARHNAYGVHGEPKRSNTQQRERAWGVHCSQQQHPMGERYGVEQSVHS